MATIFKAYFIECITNLHVGSGDANYGVIDKMVQRDPVTGYPTIHASSLKGGLREHFENDPEIKIFVDEIFGQEGEDNNTGTHKFLNADLVALPIRCSYMQYVMGLDNTVVETVNHKATNILSKKIFNSVSCENNVFGASNYQPDIFAEDIKLVKKPDATNLFTVNQSLIKSRFAGFTNEQFKTLAKNLPVVARNKVGKDKNLWYEEIVPHKTIFITFIGNNKENTDFNKALTTDLIQIGGNASVGYGLCKFHLIKFE